MGYLLRGSKEKNSKQMDHKVKISDDDFQNIFDGFLTSWLVLNFGLC